MSFTVTTTLTFDYVRVSDREDGRCWCGEDLRGTIEVTSTYAYASLNDDGSYEHAGESETDDLWNGMETVLTEDGEPLRLCEARHFYVSIVDRREAAAIAGAFAAARCQVPNDEPQRRPN
jgi:hypothetical protein